MSLGAYEVSDDGRLLAYSTDVTGFRQYTLHVKDLQTGEILPDRVEKTVSVAWAADNRTLFYTVEDQTKRPYRLYRQRSATPVETGYAASTRRRTRCSASSVDAVAQPGLSLPDQRTATRPARCGSCPPNARRPTGRLIAPREHEHEYYVDHRGRPVLYPHQRRRAQLPPGDRARRDRRSREHWKEMVQHRDDVMLEGIELFAGHLVLVERAKGLPRFRVRRPAHAADTSDDRFPGAGLRRLRRSTMPSGTPTHVPLQLPVAGHAALHLRLRHGTRRVDAAQADGGARRLRSGRTTARSASSPRAADGAKVPISLVYRAAMSRRDGAPTLSARLRLLRLSRIPVTFAARTCRLLDRGVVLAFAHIRGGGEMGKAWHDERPHAEQDEHLHRLHRCAEAPDRAEVRREGQAVDQRRQRGRPADGRGRQTCGRTCSAAVLSYVPFVDVHQHDDGRRPAADGRRVRGVGQSRTSRTSTPT